MFSVIGTWFKLFDYLKNWDIIEVLAVRKPISDNKLYAFCEFERGLLLITYME